MDVFTVAAQKCCDQKPLFFRPSFSQVANAVLAKQMGIIRADITLANFDVVFAHYYPFFNGI